MIVRRVTSIALVVVTLLAAGCVASRQPAEPPPPPVPVPTPLRIGVTSSNPPVIFRQSGRIAGVEAEMGLQLAQDLGRPPIFIEIPWEYQIPALLDGRTDIIMSGMTITSAREVRIAFSQPYLKSGLMALMQRSERAKYTSPHDLVERALNIGVRRATTADRFVRQHFPRARTVTYTTHREAILGLKYGRIDIFVDDAPIAIWLASENESVLAPLLTPLNEEYLGWGMRQTDVDFQQSVDAILERWKADGTLDRILKRWMPYWPGLD